MWWTGFSMPFDTIQKLLRTASKSKSKKFQANRTGRKKPLDIPHLDIWSWWYGAHCWAALRARRALMSAGVCVLS